MFYRNVLASLTLLLLGLAMAAPARAGAIQLFSPAMLSPGVATTDYPNVPAGFVGQVLNTPLVVPVGATNVIFTTAGQIIRFDQGIGFFGNFDPGTELIVTENASGIATGPLTIDFSMGVFEFGLSAENVFTEDGATSLFTFSVFNGATQLATFTNGGLDTLGPFFLGARATFNDRITRVIISAVSSSVAPGDQNNFAVGPVTFVVPEPTTMVLLGTGLAGIAAARRRKRQSKTE
ncbi:MAG: PEP-CTERM sorting domain-containing protein [Acidobacteriota bacterium]|nr:PEP-CTERM sorting domain-containing protein [Acidobacteriota bacterium]